MAFQISIGDVVLLSQIAWKVAQAFTKGRKSAPAEFCEVENQLYSLSAALETVQHAWDNGKLDVDGQRMSSPATPDDAQSSPSQNVFDKIIRNCMTTLKHLEGIVEKYALILEEPASGRPKMERWNHYVVKNWRKLEWTTEKGDLDSLRSQIMVHTNSLNLMVGIAASKQNGRIEESVDNTLRLVKELHEWYIENLKDVTSIKRTATNNSSNDPVDSGGDISSIESVFELAIETTNGSETICSRARLSDDWIRSFSALSLNLDKERIFVCECGRNNGRCLHQSSIAKYSLSHLTFPAQIAGNDMSWVLYKVNDRTNNNLVSLYMKKIHPEYKNRLEEMLFQPLTLRRADAILAQGTGNSLCYVSSDDEVEHILSSIAHLKIAHKCIESATFRSGRKTHIREWVEDIQILHYQTLSLTAAVAARQLSPLQPMGYAEILITYDLSDEESAGDTTNTVLQLKRNTVSGLDETNARISISSVHSTGTYADERTTRLDNVDATIQFTTHGAAKEFHQKLEDMRMELFIQSLQYPRSNETTLLNLQAARVECETLYMTDADISIVSSDQQGAERGKQYRLIIVSRNKCTIISQVLADDFFASTVPGRRPNFTGPTYVVQVGDEGMRQIYHHPNGFRQLSLSSAQANRMLDIARDTISIAG